MSLVRPRLLGLCVAKADREVNTFMSDGVICAFKSLSAVQGSGANKTEVSS